MRRISILLLIMLSGLLSACLGTGGGPPVELSDEQPTLLIFFSDP